MNDMEFRIGYGVKQVYKIAYVFLYKKTYENFWK